MIGFLACGGDGADRQLIGTLTDLGVTRERVIDWLVPVLEQLAAAKHQAG